MSGAAGCRILVISPTAAQAHQFVERVKALPTWRRNTAAEQTEKAEEHSKVQSSVSTNEDHLAPGSSTSVPWTIANKYYTAEVHFETHEFENFRVHHAIGVPAIIYVWGPGEEYREHILEIAQKVQHYEPEVSLAVRFGNDVSAVPSADTIVDDDGLDEFLSSHGFEYIEGDRAHRRPIHERDGHSDDEDSGIPGLPRVIDALSTIMWPSIVQTDATQKRKSHARDIIGWAFEEEGDEGLRALITDPSAAPADSPESQAGISAARKSRMQREMEELERWLEDEEAGSELRFSRGRADSVSADDAEVQRTADEAAQVWINSAPVVSVEGWEDMLTPPAIRTPRADHGSTEEHGFEDDFADFVSATSLPRVHTPDLTEGRLLEVNYDVERLTPTHTGISYRSLGSMSDLGGDDTVNRGNRVLESGEYGLLGDDEEDDPDLPSRAEILETSRRMFGAAAFAPTPDLVVPTPADISRAQTKEGISSQAPGPADSVNDTSLDSDGGDANLAVFDLSRVFSALQGMKDEIAGMDDESERRRAAARVALGLVYGLGVEGDRPRGNA